MKKDLHPTNYRPVVIKDDASGFAFLTQSTATSNETITWEDGNDYPVLHVHVSSASHPFFTGEERVIDVEGRVDRFKAREKAAAQRRTALGNKAKKNAARTEKKAQEPVAE